MKKNSLVLLFTAAFFYAFKLHEDSFPFLFLFFLRGHEDCFELSSFIVKIYSIQLDLIIQHKIHVN